MAQNVNIALTAGDWTQLTDADVSAIRLQNQGGYAIHIMATASATEPSSAAGAIRLDPGDILAANVALADIFPGVTSGYRVWAKGDLSCTVSVSHA